MSRARDLADLSNVINKGANLQPNLALTVTCLFGSVAHQMILQQQVIT